MRVVQKVDFGDISVEVIKKDIRNVHLSVYPPAGRVRISAVWQERNQPHQYHASIHVTQARLTRYAACVDREEVMRVLRAFESAELEYVLIGAAAMGFHGLVRVTEDLDLFIRATPENIDKLRSAFRAAYGGDPHID